MQFIYDMGDANYLIRAFEPGKITVNDTALTRSFIISPQTLQTDWPITSLAELTLEALEPLLATEMEVLLLGTGERHQFPAMALLKAVRERGKTLEIMNTHAACRTYAVLASEGRKVAAAMILERTAAV